MKTKQHDKRRRLERSENFCFFSREFHLRQGLWCSAAPFRSRSKGSESLHSEQNDAFTHPLPIVKPERCRKKQKANNVQTLKGLINSSQALWLFKYAGYSFVPTPAPLQQASVPPWGTAIKPVWRQITDKVSGRTQCETHQPHYFPQDPQPTKNSAETRVNIGLSFARWPGKMTSSGC